MIKRALHPEQWQILRRLGAAGCPVDYEHLPQASYPLRVFTEDSIWGTNIFPLPRGTGIAFRLNIIVTVSFTICQIRLRADWLKGGISWLESCRDQSRHWGHVRYYCFHECSYGPDICFRSDEVLNSRMGRWEALKRGMGLHGFLVGTFPDILPSTAEAKLEATVVIEDLFGEEYPFPVEINNSKGITRPTSPLPEGEVI